MGVCAQCAHFRRVRPTSQLLAAALGTTAAGAEVTNALAKIVDDEQKVQAGEVEIKGKEGSADRDSWGTRPMMSEYCGLQEKEEIYLICEVKNRGMQCEDFLSGQPERHACANCARRVPSKGSTRDQSLEKTYGRLINAAVATQASPQSPQGLLQSHRAGVAARKALEIAGAYAAKGHVLAIPQYLDSCAQFSTQDEYVICVMQNPHNTCSAWIADT
jgi:hypothetical protein